MSKFFFKTIQAIAAAVIVFTFSRAAPVGAQSPLPTDPPFGTPGSALALSAVAGMYAPPSSGESFWSNVICSEMSAGGCDYFKANLESMLWQKGQTVAIEGSSVNFVGVVSNLADGSQVWKMTVTIYDQGGKSLTSNVFAHVVYDQAQGQWLLNRVLYGPYINL
jgi:hypothetical protein